MKNGARRGIWGAKVFRMVQPVRFFAKKKKGGTGNFKAEKKEALKEETYELFDGIDCVDVYKKGKSALEMAVAEFKKSLDSIQADRGNPNLLDDVQVDAYGEMFALKDLAQVIMRNETSLLVNLYD